MEVGRMWPADRSVPTPALDNDEQSFLWISSRNLCEKFLTQK